MNQSINISYFQQQENREKQKEKNKRKQKKKIIVANNFFCENNIFICDKIRENIPNCSDKFEILTSAISLDSSISSEEKKGKKENEKDMYLLEYEHNEEELKSFFEYLSAIKSDTKKYIFTIITTYQKLLQNILLLQNANIIHFNINYETICFDETRQVLLRDWTNAMTVKNAVTIKKAINGKNAITVQNTYITRINDDISTNSPLEIYVLSHMNKEKDENKDKEKGSTILNQDSIESICKTYVNNPYLSFITASSKDKLYIKSVDFLMPFINMPREKIINEMMKYSYTWDNYSLTIIYLHIVGSFKNKNVFFLDFFRLLNKNLLTKAGIQETIDAFDSLFYKHTKWDDV